MKAAKILTSRPSSKVRPGPILRFAGEADSANQNRPAIPGRFETDPDERCRRDIRTPGLNLAPAFPPRRTAAVAVLRHGGL